VTVRPVRVGLRGLGATDRGRSLQGADSSVAHAPWRRRAGRTPRTARGRRPERGSVGVRPDGRGPVVRSTARAVRVRGENGSRPPGTRPRGGLRRRRGDHRPPGPACGSRPVVGNIF
jgi:hypothetical protein